MAGWTLTAIRQFAAREAGKFETGTATSGSTTSILECTTWPFKSSIVGTNLYKDYWAYRPAAAATGDRLRYVAIPAPTSGQYTVDLAYTNAPYAAGVGEAFEFHGMFPPAGNGPQSWLTLINDGLKNCLVPIEYSFNPANTTDSRFSLATVAAWLTDPWLIRKVGVLSGGASRSANDPYLIRPLHGVASADLDGVTVYLNTYPMTFATTDTIYLTILTPAYYAIQANGSGAFTQTGMALETDVAPLDNLELAGYAALCEGWRRFSQVLDQTVQGRAINSLARAVTAFNEASPEWNLRLPMQLKRRRQWGPPLHPGGGGYVSGWARG